MSEASTEKAKGKGSRSQIEEWFSWITTVGGAAIGLVAFVYVLGGVVMWLRFHKAGLPADQAVAVMSKQQLLVVGLRLMVLPALAIGGLAAGLTLVHAGQRQSASSRSEEAAEWLRVLKRPPWFVLVVVVVLVLLLPASFASVTWATAVLLVFGYWLHESGTQRTGQARAVRMALVAIFAAGLVSLGRQTDQPVQLLHASAQRSVGSSGDPSRKPASVVDGGLIEGIFVTADSGVVILGDAEGWRCRTRSRSALRVSSGPTGHASS